MKQGELYVGDIADKAGIVQRTCLKYLHELANQALIKNSEHRNLDGIRSIRSRRRLPYNINKPMNFDNQIIIHIYPN